MQRGGENLKALNVLMVEDDACVAELLGELLAEMGHKVCAVETTEAGAVAAASRHKPDLMIVDVLLREGSGIGAVESIMQAGSVPHFFVSGNISKVLALRPAAVVLQKPYSEAGLVSAMNRALERA
jgi:two-component system, response regulator PdtaR